MIQKLAKKIPAELLDRSGAVFYSGRNAFESKCPLYMLGVNPGGDPELQANETIRAHTRKVMDEEAGDWSAYRDETWGNGKPGTSGMQPRVLHLLGKLGFTPGEVPASNVVFVRSRREAGIKSGYRALAEACWSFHLAAIQQLQPRVVLCFGQTPGNYVRQKLGANSLIDEFVEGNNRRWRSQAYQCDDRIVVVATHPSIADWTAAATDPTPLVKRALTRIA